jgi:Spy/CpxP family protein refolding chaperone
MNQPNRIKVQVWLVFLLVFGLGGLTGVSLDRIYQSRYAAQRPPFHGGPGGPGRGGPRRMLERMKQDLNLSDEQAEAIHKIFDESRKEGQNRLDACPGFKEARQRTQERIRAVLNSEQQKKYEEITKQREAMRDVPPPPPETR